MAQMRDYATKKKGKTEVYPFWNLKDIKNMIDYFKNQEDLDSYLTYMLGLLLGRRIGDTVMVKWSDFYYENGARKYEINTIEEQKTGKVTNIPISNMVFNCIDIYCKKKNINPSEHINEYIFNIQSKTQWIYRKNNPIYDENSIDKWCEELSKDISDNRKHKIISDFERQTKYKTLGEYLYNEVEYMDIVKWQIDEFRKKFNKAAKYAGITYNVSCHSLRKTFGYWSKIIHPDDPASLETLQDIFNHSDTSTTLHYIGLSEQRKKRYFDDFGNMISEVENGNEVNINNSPIVSIKNTDMREIISLIIKNKSMNDIDLFNYAMNEIDKRKVKNI